MSKEIRIIMKSKGDRYKQYKKAMDNGVKDRFNDFEEDFNLIDSFIKVLEPSEQMIFIYRYLEGSTVAETIVDLSYSQQTFYRRQAELIEKFKRFIGK